MKTRNLIIPVVTALLLSGCIPSVNPFYTKEDIVFDPRLLGEWQTKEPSDEPQLWKFEKGDDKAYKLTVTEKDSKRGEFNAHLFKLKQEFFLDLIPSNCEYATNQADLVAFAMYPGHLLVRVSQLEPGLKLAFFDFEWLKKHLEANPKTLAHQVEQKDRILLTASTRDLKRFVLKHIGEGELFQKPGEMVRRSNPVTP
ncbi:MAG: hypothetical protein MUF81_00915 [Verrucomicrobia bacterium]|jgi:hypothetical protein|nr:hypothetical protein [Verrucomicrobiota bacterium]